MGYNGHRIGKISQGIASPIVAESRVNHEGLGFAGIEENSITIKITFVKEKRCYQFGLRIRRKSRNK